MKKKWRGSGNKLKEDRKDEKNDVRKKMEGTREKEGDKMLGNEEKKKMKEMKPGDGDDVKKKMRGTSKKEGNKMDDEDAERDRRKREMKETGILGDEDGNERR